MKSRSITMTAGVLLWTLLGMGALMGTLGKEVRINNIVEFLNFTDNVNLGTNYSGTTVFLDSDLDFSGKTFEPIGNKNNYFRGVFNGQGYVISNLVMNSSLQYVGLFGYSEGLAIRNVILDSSCSITSTYVGSEYAYVGGIIGYCNGLCTIENSVNIGSITFSGTINGNDNSLYLGGITGSLDPSDYESTVKNCANYGDVTHSGKSSYSYIGGIVGYSQGSSLYKLLIYNCLNHGTIIHNGTISSSLYLGGITGDTEYTTIENCVSGGKISTNNSTYTGSIVGGVSSGTSINYCYYISDLNGYSKYGRGTPSSESNTLSYNSTSFQLSGTVSIGNYTGTSLIDAPFTPILRIPPLVITHTGSSTRIRTL